MHGRMRGRPISSQLREREVWTARTMTTIDDFLLMSVTNP